MARFTNTFIYNLFVLDKKRRILALRRENTRQYLETRNLLQSKDVLTFEGYKNLLNNKTIGPYRSISLEAYYFINHPDNYAKKFQRNQTFVNIDRINTTFKLVGLRTLKRNKEAHKILKPMEYYPLDQAIKPLSEPLPGVDASQKFEFTDSAIETLYDLDYLKVNITSIVGKNGSGKSTLLDLILMGIYNLSIEFGYLDSKENKFLKGLNFEIYWLADTLYKCVLGKEILIYEFKKSQEEQKIVFELNDLPFSSGDSRNKLFYTILVNYSHYALNNADYAIDWITPLSHKNDGYITPIVINPQRTNGNIDINREKDLLNQRLLLNLLELHEADFPEQSFRHIDNGKYLRFFSVTFNRQKYTEKRKEAKEQTYEDPKIIQFFMDEIIEAYQLNKDHFSKLKYKKELELYMVSKLLTIVSRYNRYKTEYKKIFDNLIKHNIASTVEGMDFQFELALKDSIERFIKDIKKDRSHITVKFNQAINYFVSQFVKNFE